ncbi:hypothetical protein [Streptomyces sp. NPDC048623]
MTGKVGVDPALLGVLWHPHAECLQHVHRHTKNLLVSSSPKKLGFF